MSQRTKVEQGEIMDMTVPVRCDVVSAKMHLWECLLDANS